MTVAERVRLHRARRKSALGKDDSGLIAAVLKPRRRKKPQTGAQRQKRYRERLRRAALFAPSRERERERAAPPLADGSIHCGDCFDVLDRIDRESVDLIVTSPPYAGRREGLPVRDWCPWFLERSKKLREVLKPHGSFVLNIKECVINGQRSTHVIELIMALQDQGWLWVEEYLWHKTNPPPGKWPDRFRDAWERLLHFTRQKKFAMYQDEVMVPVGDWPSRG